MISSQDLNDKAIQFMKSENPDIKESGVLLWSLVGIANRLCQDATLIDGCPDLVRRGHGVKHAVDDLAWLIDRYP